MCEARSMRRAPFVDKTIYANWNGMMISSYLEAYKAFGIEEHLRAALTSLDRLLENHQLQDGSILHTESGSGPTGFLDDQVEVANALLSAFEVTSRIQYLEQALRIVDLTIEMFGDPDLGGFYDSSVHGTERGLLTIRSKPFYDSPVASANSMAIVVLNKCFLLTGNQKYRDQAQMGLEHFVQLARSHEISCAHYFLAMDQFLNPPPHVVVVSRKDDVRGRQLHRCALKTYRPGKTVTFFEPETTRYLPEVLKNTVQQYTRPVAYVCSLYSCAPPAFAEDELVTALQSFGNT